MVLKSAQSKPKMLQCQYSTFVWSHEDDVVTINTRQRIPEPLLTMRTAGKVLRNVKQMLAWKSVGRESKGPSEVTSRFHQKYNNSITTNLLDTVKSKAVLW